MELSSQILSDITIHMKYARYKDDKKRRETWQEIVYRNRDMHLDKYPHLSSEIVEVYNNFVLPKKVLPSMRSLQFAGKPIKISPNRLYNCAFLPMDDWRAFSEIMFLLLGGSGVGFSVQKHHVDKLPEIKKPKKSKRFLIGDSIEGWADSVKYLIKAYLSNGALPIFDFSDIRPKGSRLVTSGGKAPGPEPLKECLLNIKNILDRKSDGEKLKTIEVHDIVCYIADGVLSGGIRRAALISLFSFDDEDMIESKQSNIKVDKLISAEHPSYTDKDGLKIDTSKMVLNFIQNGIEYKDVIIYKDEKSGLFYDMEQYKSDGTFGWWVANPQRGRSNNSALVLRHRIKKRDFDKFWKRIKDSHSGEPGIYFSNDMEWGSNPCVEIALRPFQFCVAGDTKLITKDGICNIEDVVDKEIEIWNGKNWSKTKPYKTGDADKLYRVWFSDGSYLDATKNHKFLVKNRFQKDFSEIETIELQKLLKTSEYGLQIPRSNIKYEDGNNIYNAYDYGFILGDGFVYSDKRYVETNLFENDKNIKFINSTIIGEYYNYNNKKFITHRFNCDNEFAYKLKYNYGLPKELFSWDKESIINFISGWADAGGSNASKGIRIYGRYDKLKDAQLLLTKVGINSSFNLMQKSGEKTNLGIRKNDVWYLQITITSELNCQRLICNNSKISNKGMYQIVKRIDELDGLHKSYCLTENEKHQCVFNNVLTKQCNLVEINGNDIENQEDFNNRARVASFIATLQASYTEFHYLRDVWQKTTEKDALLGVGITGIAGGKLDNIDLREGATQVIEENKRVAKLIGIKSAARTTCVKPSGTSSLVLGTSSGIHAWHDEYYIRRIRVGKNESIYQYLLKHHPELVEDDVFKPTIQAVISVPQKAPNGAMLRTESAMTLLERVKRFNDEWVATGHVDGHNKHNVSCTVSAKDDEWDDIGKWMWENRNSFNGLSVLPYNGGTYKQAPFESISKSKYYEMVKILHEIKLEDIIELEDMTDLKGEVACSGNSCEIT